MTITTTAQATLGPLLPPGWTLSEPRRRGAQTVELQLHPPGGQGLGIGLEWSEDDGPAYACGPRYSASYRRGPGLVDLGQEGAPAELKSLALAACDALAALTEGPSLRIETAPVSLDGGDPIDALLTALPSALGEALGTDALPNPEGWTLVGVREMARWTRVAEVQLATGERTLTMIVTPTDPERSAFRRTRRHDLVYYSDDLAVAEHDALYARDRAMIDAFATWFSAWDDQATLDVDG
ncbi:MAG: hypothetical protein QF464_01000 [Myxococcota bacterium]|jgi:hypothetical protein|nr:hypothetical protein [Myxococcota bacterium]